MAEFQLASDLEVQKWISQYMAEYVREARFGAYTGRSNNSIIVAKYELQREAGKTINIPLITRLKGEGVTGSQTLDGSEEELGNYNCPISVEWRRNGVRVPKSETYKSEIDVMNAARDMLRQWSAEKLRDDVIEAMGSVISSGSTTVNYADASEANKDAWLAANADRILFGAAKSNNSGNDHSASLGNVDTSADKCSASIMSLAKRMAKTADPHIRPYRTETGREFFLAFHGSRTFRDLKADSVITQANREARPRNVDENPLFQDGDLIYDGVMHVEVPEIDDWASDAGLDGAGNSSADVRPVFVCGQQAAGIAWGQEPTPRTDRLKDYQFRPGVAIEELLGVKKLAFNGVQHGMVTAYCAAAADS